MPRIIYPSQQFALQQKIARKSVMEFQPKIKAALQADFDKAADLVKELGVSQVINFNRSFFNKDSVSNVLKTLYETTGGYTAAKYQKIFDGFKKSETINFLGLEIDDVWVAFMLSYWYAISGQKMWGIENTTDKEIEKILAYAFLYGRENNLSINEVNAMAIQLLREGKINVSRSLLIARTETHQALSTGAMGSAMKINIPLLKQWVHAEYVGKPRVWHQALDTQTDPDKSGARLEVNQPFLVTSPNGTVEMQYAHDANGGAINNCNCRCCTVYV